MKFCSQCGNNVSLRIPDADDRQRYVCDNCAYIHYLNPRIIVCTIPCHEDKVLLCKRAIEPRYGLWTLPGGFLENGETTIEGALRETREEANARVSISSLYSVYNLPHIDQVHLFFLSTLQDLEFSAGSESLEVALLTEDEIPWDDIAFPAVSNTLQLYFSTRHESKSQAQVADVLVDQAGTRIIKPCL